MPTTDAEARAAAAALRATAETLINCALRESPDARIDGDVAQLPLGGGARLEVALAYRSLTGHHRLALPARLRPAGGAPARELGFTELAQTIVDALADDDATRSARAALLERIDGSRAAVQCFLTLRGDELEAPFPSGPQDFLTSEQSLVLGHPLHPTPKSRGEMTAEELVAYSPETKARFALHWLAVDDALVKQGSAVRDEAGTPRPAAALVDDLLGDEAAALRAEAGEGFTLVPAHPWQLGRMREEPRVRALIDAGRLRELGPHGAQVTPTSSVRTVAHEQWPWQLKFSLNLRVTNSMRVNLPRELDRAVEAAELARTKVGGAMGEVAPRWVVVHDPAHLAVRDSDGELIDGLSVLFRENRWRAGSGLDASAITALCQDHPFDGRSRLARIIDALAAELGEDPRDMARYWFGRYLEVFAGSVLRLYLNLGLTFEPHAQNVLLELDGGLPQRAVHRDSQGYFHREAAHRDLVQVIPGLGEATESIFPEALADQRLVYYPFVNNALGVIGALGRAGLADEATLLGDLRTLIEGERQRGGRYPATLLDRLLDDPTWPCKANLRTRIRDLDELVGDIAEQSVYGAIANPLQGPGR